MNFSEWPKPPSEYRIGEDDWLASNDLDAMLEFLASEITDRRARLFMAACLRRVWHLVEDSRYRHAIAVSERFADGAASKAELGEAVAGAHRARGEAGHSRLGRDPYDAARSHRQDVLALTMSSVAKGVARLVADEAVPNVPPRYIQSPSHGECVAFKLFETRERVDWDAAYSAERVAQCALLRDLFGNPFRPLDLNWLRLVTTQDQVREKAEWIYASESFEELTNLGELLQGIAPVPASVADHIHAASKHVRGCWVLDALLHP